MHAKEGVRRGKKETGRVVGQRKTENGKAGINSRVITDSLK